MAAKPNGGQQPRILADLNAANAEIEALKAKLAASESAGGEVKFKVAEKGGVSAYVGRQRYPVTLYADQWGLLLAHSDELKAFIEANRPQLRAPKV